MKTQLLLDYLRIDNQYVTIYRAQVKRSSHMCDIEAVR